MKFKILVFIAFLFSVVSAQAANKEWTGAVDSDWSNSGNWTGGKPGPGDRAYFNAGNVSCTIPAGETVLEIHILTGYTGVVSLGSNTLTVKAKFIVDDGALFDAGTGKILINHNNNCTINTDADLYDLEFDLSVATRDIAISKSFTVINNLTITSVDAINNNSIDVLGDIVTTDNSVTGTCYIVMAGVSGDQTISGGGMLNRLTIDNTSGDILLTSNLEFGGATNAELNGASTKTIKNSGGKLIVKQQAKINYGGSIDELEVNSNKKITLLQDLTINNKLEFTSILEIEVSSFLLSGDFVTTDPTIIADNNSFVVLNSTGDQNISGGGAIENLRISNTGGNVNLTGTLTIAPDNTGKFEGTSGGNISGGTIIIGDACTIDFNGSVDNLELNTPPADDVTLNQDLTINKKLTITEIDEIKSGYFLVLETFYTSDVSVKGSGGVKLEGNLARTIDGGGSINNLEINGTGFVTMLSDLTVCPLITGSFGGSYTGALAKTITIGDACVVSFSGSVENLIINTSQTSDDITLDADLTVNNKLTITQVDQIITNSFKVYKEFVTTDATVLGSGGVKLEGPDARTIDGGGSINHLAINGTGSVTLLSDLFVSLSSGSLTGTFAGSVSGSAYTITCKHTTSGDFAGAIPNLTLDMTTKHLALTQDLNVDGNLHVKSIGNINTSSIKVKGDYSVSDLSGAAGSGYVELVGTTNQSLIRVGSGISGPLIINTTSGKAQIASDFHLKDELKGAGDIENIGGKLVIVHTTVSSLTGYIDDLELSMTQNFTVNSTVKVKNSLTITDAGAITGDIEVEGDVISNDANQDMSNGKYIKLVGTTNQDLSGIGRIESLQIDKSSGDVVFSSANVRAGFINIFVTSGVLDVTGYLDFSATTTTISGSGLLDGDASGAISSNIVVNSAGEVKGEFDIAGNVIINSGGSMTGLNRTIDGNVTVNLGGLFTGSGQGITGNLDCFNGSTLDVGSSPGCLSVNGNMNLRSGSIFVLDIDNHANACQDFDQVNVNGTVDINAQLEAGSVAGIPGQTVVIINKTSTGTFNSRFNRSVTNPEEFGGHVFFFDNRGGDGNDFSISGCLGATPTVSDVSCFGESDGAISVSISDASSTALVYAWSGPNSFNSTDKDISNLYSAGDYDFTATDPNGCYVTISVPLEVPSALNVAGNPSTFNGFNISCHGGSNGSINLNVSGGTTLYSYEWSTNETTQNISGLIQGEYDVTVSDGNGCLEIYSTTLTEPEDIQIDALLSTYIGGHNISCNGASDGSIWTNVSGGVSPFNYHWSTGFTGVDVIDSDAGGYALTLTDQNFCTRTANWALTEPVIISDHPILSTYFGNVQIRCHGGSDGAIDLGVQGGTLPYNYIWSGGQTTAEVTGLSAGVLVVTITDQNQCLLTRGFTLTEPNELVVSPVLSTYIGGQNIRCTGESNGSVNLLVGGGTSTYLYKWSTGATDATLNNLSSGVYPYTLTDANNCIINSAITLTQPAELAAQLVLSTYVGGRNVSCFGASDGSIQVQTAGGTSGYSYNWANGQSTAIISGLPVSDHDHAVTISDVNSCRLTKSVTLTQPAKLVINPTVSTYIGGRNVSCFGSSDGSVFTAPTGGTTLYTYKWSDGSTNQNINTLAAGTTSLTVTDANLCFAKSATITLTQPAKLVVNPTVSTYIGGRNVSCFGSSDGSVFTAPTGGTTLYTYKWSDGSTNQNINTLAAGTTSLTVTDANLCFAKSATITLTQPAKLVVNPTVSTYIGGRNVSCFGSSDGSVFTAPTGGTTLYTYKWSDGSTNQNINTLAAGTTSVTVTDANLCFAKSATITLTQPAKLVINPTVSTYFGGRNVSCFGSSDGSVFTAPTGGTTLYTYKWSNGTTTQNVTGLGAIPIAITFTDVNSCKVTESFTLTQPDVLVLQPSLSTYIGGRNVSCFGSSDGSVFTAPTGGTTLYTYKWSNGTTTQNVTGLGAIPIAITFTDVNSCKVTESFTLTQPDVLVLQPSLSTYIGGRNVSCFGSSDGSVFTAPTGGTTLYTYKWSNGTTTQNVTGLGAIPIAITFTDVNSCKVTESFTLTQPAPLGVNAILSQYSVGNISCNGQSDGAIDLSVEGGTTAYLYNWNTSETTEDISGLSAGIYSATITDQNNCQEIYSTTLTEPEALTISLVISQQVTCNGGTDGSIDLFVFGGNSAYQYFWDGPGAFTATTQNLTDVPKGTYKVTVTDGQSCAAFDQIVISQPKKVKALCTDVTDASCFGLSDGYATVSQNFGVGPFSYLWPDGQTTATATGLAAGDYIVTVTDDGCNQTSSCTATVDEPDEFLVFSQVSRYGNFPNVYHISCQGADDGWIDINYVGGTQINMQFDWSPSTYNGLDYADGLGAGKYFVTVTDGQGCQDILGPINLIEPSGNLTASISGTDVTCNGASNGVACLNASGGSGTYTYDWSSGGNTQCVSGLAPGVYTGTVSDNGSCEQAFSVTISEPSGMSVSSAQNNVDCFGKGQGGVSLTVSGGTPGYTYSWQQQGGSFTSSKSFIVNRKAGVYDVTITDNNGCTRTESFTITQPPKIIITPTITKPSCFGDSDGSISLAVSGGFGSYSYAWDLIPSTSHNPTGLSANTYRVTVTDGLGCEMKRNIKVKDPVLLQVTGATPDGNPCANKGTLTVTHTGGTGSKTYQWSSGATTRRARNLSPGSYSVTVTDTKGCTAEGGPWSIVCKAMSDEFALVNIQLYPNPATGVVTLDFEDGFEGETMRILDLSGRLILEQNLKGASERVQVGKLASGSYVITVDFGNYIWRSKLQIE